jgi:DNA polymerase-4
MQPIIIHLDMNSYFATAEQQDNPAFRGKVLGVCEHLGGIIIAASIEAKRWGIKTGTPVWEARKLYPKIILTKTHPDRYRLYIKRVIKVVSDYTGFVEQASIDELYADLTKATNIRRHSERSEESQIRDPSSSDALGLRMTLEMVDPFEEAVKIAQIIKRRMKKEVGDYLTCSIGIAENKLLAKIASDLKKPDGIVVIKPFLRRHSEGVHPTEESLKAKTEILRPSDALRVQDDVAWGKVLVLSKADLYQRLELTDIPGIGARQEKNLNKLGIKTLVDLKNYPPSLLVARFGIIGHHLHQMGQLQGSWKPEVDPSRQGGAEAEKDDTIKSIGHMYTLPKEFREKKFFVPVLYKLCEMVAKRMRKQGLSGNIIHFYLRDKDYQGFGESKKLGFYVYDGREIFLQAADIYADLLRRSGREPLEYKLIGITMAGLRPYSGQLSLFGHEERQKRLVDALDKINAKYGDFTVSRAPVFGAKGAFQDSVGFGRIKEI